jgi:hypothetical protein
MAYTWQGSLPARQRVQQQQLTVCPCPYVAGPPLQPYTPYNLFGPGMCRVEASTTFLTCPSSNGTGSTPPEQFIPVRPDLSAGPIRPGEQAVWQSAQTGKFCRVVAVAGQSRVQCDVDSLGQATPLEYTGTGAAAALQGWTNVLSIVLS